MDSGEAMLKKYIYILTRKKLKNANCTAMINTSDMKELTIK